MDKYGKLINEHTLQFERMLPGPVDKVWEYLVDPEKRGKWFSAGTMNHTPGEEITFVFNHSTLSPEKDPLPDKYKVYEGGSTSTAHIIAVEPPHLLKFNWEGGIVTMELSEADAGVRLVLTHEKLRDEKDYRLGVMGGWHTHLDILVDLLNGKLPKGFWKVHTRLEQEYEDRFYG